MTDRYKNIMLSEKIRPLEIAMAHENGMHRVPEANPSQGHRNNLPVDDPEPGIEKVAGSYESLQTRYERLRYAFAHLIEHSGKLDQQIQSMQDIHLMTDAAGVILQADRAASLISPLHRLVGSFLSEWIKSSHLKQYEDMLSKAVKAGTSTQEKWESHVRQDAAYAPTLKVTVHMMTLVEEGSVSIVHWMLRPHQTQALKHPLPLRLEVEFDNAGEGMLVANAAGEIQAVNPAFSEITGYSDSDVIGRNPRLLQSGLQDVAYYEDFWHELKSAGNWQGLMLNRKKNGEIFPEWLKVTAARGPDGDVVSYTAFFRDLSRAVATEVEDFSETLPPHVYRAQPLLVASKHGARQW